MSQPSIGVDFHIFDGLYQGSRSHLLGIYSQAIAKAPRYRFVFFLREVEKLRDEYPVFGSGNVKLVRMPSLPGPVRLAAALPFLRLRHGVDLLHMQYRLPLLPSGPCAATIHDILFEDYPQFFSRFFTLQSRLSFRHAARRSAVLFSVSEYSRHEISTKYGIDRERIAVTHNGVDFTRFRPGDDGLDTLGKFGIESGRYLLTVGRLEPRKNHETLFRAYARLATDLPLVVVGQKDFGWQHLKAVIDELGISSRVRFLEKVGDRELPDLMRHCTLFVYPAYAEGFGMPVAEAMASGCAVVTSGTTSLPEVGGDAALYCDPFDPASFADAMARLLADETLRRTFAERGLSQARRFDWATSADVLLASFDRYFATREA